MGTVTAMVVGAAVAGAHWTQTLGPGAPGVQPGTTRVVRSEGARGETVTVCAVVLVAPGAPQDESCAEQVMVWGIVKTPVVSGQMAVVNVTTSVVTWFTGQCVTVGGHDVTV